MYVGIILFTTLSKKSKHSWVIHSDLKVAIIQGRPKTINNNIPVLHRATAAAT